MTHLLLGRADEPPTFSADLWPPSFPASRSFPDPRFQQLGLSRDNLSQQMHSDNLSKMHSAKIQGMVPPPGLLHRGPEGAGKGRGSGDTWSGLHGIPGIQRKQDERSHPSSEDTPLYLEDLPNSDPAAEYEASDSTEAGDAELKIYEEYLANGKEQQEPTGVTIMLRDIPYRMRVEPHVFDLLQSTSDLSHVDYIYLPMTINQCSDAVRNKGYCFIHFSNNDSAQRFVSRLEHYVLPRSMFPSARMMIAGMAKFQGLSLNLHNVLDIHSKKWRPKNGYAYIRCAGGELTSCALLRLRNLLKRRAAAPTEKKRPITWMKRRVDGKAFQDPLLLAPLI
jgi:hypothetical protein